MKKLYPIITKENAHLFVDPAIHQPDYYALDQSDDLTSFIKPGRIPNLMKLCAPKGMVVSKTLEPNIKTMAIESVIFGALDKFGDWAIVRVDGLNIRLAQEGPSLTKLNGAIPLVIGESNLVDYRTEEPVHFVGNVLAHIEMKYYRGSRELTWDNTGNFFNQEVQIYGIKLNLDLIDSRSENPELCFKPKEDQPMFRTRITPVLTDLNKDFFISDEYRPYHEVVNLDDESIYKTPFLSNHIKAQGEVNLFNICRPKDHVLDLTDEIEASSIRITGLLFKQKTGDQSFTITEVSDLDLGLSRISNGQYQVVGPMVITGSQMRNPMYGDSLNLSDDCEVEVPIDINYNRMTNMMTFGDQEGLDVQLFGVKVSADLINVNKVPM